MANSMKELAIKSLDAEIATLEQHLVDLRASRETLDTMSNDQIAAVVSISSLHQRLLTEDSRRRNRRFQSPSME